MRLEVQRRVAAPRELVWRVLVDWERQADWMVDAEAVEVLTPHREGEGVTLRVPTRVLGVTIQDVLRVTRWEPDRVLEVAHLGRLISGGGAFELDDEAGGTRLRWWEDVDPPLGPVGEVAARIALRPVLTWIFARSLARFARLCEAEAAAA